MLWPRPCHLGSHGILERYGRVTALRAAAALISTELPHHWASMTATTPLTQSPNNVRMPAVFPMVRATLVAPILPLPLCRGSTPPYRRAMRSPKEREPSRYASTSKPMSRSMEGTFTGAWRDIFACNPPRRSHSRSSQYRAQSYRQD